MKSMRWIPLLTALLALDSARGELRQLQIMPTRDATIYNDEGPNGLLNQANGSGNHLFAGETGVDIQDYRRALLYFDLSAIPAGSRVDVASLALTISKVPPDAGINSFALHRVTSAWGEGPSDPPEQEGTGTAPSAGDATWQYGFFATTPWTNAGGDFLSTPSGAATIDTFATVLGFAGAGLAADVQGWVNGADNHGWLVMGQETPSPLTYATVRRFFSRNVGLEDGAPVLTVSYEVVPEPSSAMLLLLALGLWRGFRPRV